MDTHKLKELPDLSKEVRKKVIIHNPFIKKKSNSFLDLYRIELDDDFTRIDFLAYPDTKTYKSDWWVSIEQDSFIRPIGSDMKLKLVRAVGIPFSPIKYFFKGRNEGLPFTLFFPLLPSDVTHIDIIEKEVPYGSYFNFYNVSLEWVRRKPIVIDN